MMRSLPVSNVNSSGCRFNVAHFGFTLVTLLFLGTVLSTAPHAASPRALPDQSLYHMDATWKRDDGKNMHLADLQGKPRILAMFFSRCDNICPMLTGQLKVLEREMSASLRTKTGFVLVTLDTENDDTESLADYRARMGYSKERWTLLRGTADDTRELANRLGVTYKPKDDDGQIDHNGLIVVLDSQGRIVEKTSGITDRKAFLKLLERLVKE